MFDEPRTQAPSSMRRKDSGWGWSRDSFASGGEGLYQITNFHRITLVSIARSEYQFLNNLSHMHAEKTF